jgi:hypothetical protein
VRGISQYFEPVTLFLRSVAERNHEPVTLCLCSFVELDIEPVTLSWGCIDRLSVGLADDDGM